MFQFQFQKQKHIQKMEKEKVQSEKQKEEEECLPVELWLEIFSKLNSVKELENLRQVNKTWKKLLETEQFFLWKPLVETSSVSLSLSVLTSLETLSFRE